MGLIIKTIGNYINDNKSPSAVGLNPNQPNTPYTPSPATLQLDSPYSTEPKPIKSYKNRSLTIITNVNNEFNQTVQKSSKASGKKTTVRAGFIEFGLPIVLRLALEKPLGVIWASVISSVPIILSMLYSIFLKNMFTPFSLIMIASIYVDLVFRLLFQDARLQDFSGFFINAAISFIAFITIPFNNSFLYYIAKPSSTGGDYDKGLEYDALWRIPLVIRAYTNISLGLGTGFLLLAGIIATLAFKLPVEYINIATTVANIIGSIAIVAWATWYKKKNTASALSKFESHASEVTAV